MDELQRVLGHKGLQEGSLRAPGERDSGRGRGSRIPTDQIVRVAGHAQAAAGRVGKGVMQERHVLMHHAQVREVEGGIGRLGAVCGAVMQHVARGQVAEAAEVVPQVGDDVAADHLEAEDVVDGDDVVEEAEPAALLGRLALVEADAGRALDLERLEREGPGASVDGVVHGQVPARAVPEGERLQGVEVEDVREQVAGDGHSVQAEAAQPGHVEGARRPGGHAACAQGVDPDLAGEAEAAVPRVLVGVARDPREAEAGEGAPAVGPAVPRDEQGGEGGEVRRPRPAEVLEVDQLVDQGGVVLGPAVAAAVGGQGQGVDLRLRLGELPQDGLGQAGAHVPTGGGVSIISVRRVAGVQLAAASSGYLKLLSWPRRTRATMSAALAESSSKRGQMKKARGSGLYLREPVEHHWARSQWMQRDSRSTASPARKCRWRTWRTGMDEGTRPAMLLTRSGRKGRTTSVCQSTLPTRARIFLEAWARLARSRDSSCGGEGSGH